jgi:hypothetical protein
MSAKFLVCKPEGKGLLAYECGHDLPGDMKDEQLLDYLASYYIFKKDPPPCNLFENLADHMTLNNYRTRYFRSQLTSFNFFKLLPYQMPNIHLNSTFPNVLYYLSLFSIKYLSRRSHN